MQNEVSKNFERILPTKVFDFLSNSVSDIDK